jgi:DNA-binding GntR family transcriptional regulator
MSVAAAFRGLSAGHMPAGRGLAPLANVPDGKRRDGPPQLVIRRKHPVIAMPVLQAGSRPADDFPRRCERRYSQEIGFPRFRFGMQSMISAGMIRGKMSQTVSVKLSEAIISGEFKPGTKISEPALSTLLGVSRAPIREALIELGLRGLVEFDATGRTRVPVLKPQDINEIYMFRLMIDPVAAGLAAQHATPEFFADLEANIAATRRVKTLADVSRLDTEFHDRIVVGSGNRRLLLCWNGLRDQVGLWLAQMHLRHQAVTKRTRQATVNSHETLLEAIRSGHEKKAAAEARRHVAAWIKLLPAAPQKKLSTEG